MSLGDVIREKRKAMKLNLADVADYIGVRVSYLSDLERGAKNSLPDQKLERLAEKLELDFEQLRAAQAESRRAFRLDAQQVPPQQRVIGAVLERRWTSLTTQQVSDLERLLLGEWEDERNGRSRV